MVWRRTKREEDLEEYRRMKRVVKRMVREAKKRVNEKWTLSLACKYLSTFKIKLDEFMIGKGEI